MLRLFLCMALLGLMCGLAQSAPDEVLLGRDAGYPIGVRSTWSVDEGVRVGSLSNLEAVYGPLGFETLRRGATASPLPAGAADALATLRYSVDGTSFYNLDGYMARNRVTALMVLRDGHVLVERYQYGRTAQHRFTSMSMAKTLTALAVGIALADGAIRSIDDPVTAYVPEISSAQFPSQYGRTTLRHLLTMSSGAYNPPAYDPRGGTAQIVAAGGQGAPTNAWTGASGMARLNPVTVQAPGRGWSYFGGDTFVLGLVVRAATGKTPAALLAERVWGPMGAEDDASWITDGAGNTIGHFGFNARLRDWGRLGALLANSGRLPDGRALLAPDWLRKMTSLDAVQGHFTPQARNGYYGYGFQSWLFPTAQRRYALLGIFGQAVFVDPEQRLVMVQMSAWPDGSAADASSSEQSALWQALVNQTSPWDGAPAHFAADALNTPAAARRLQVTANASSADAGRIKKLVVAALLPDGNVLVRTPSGWAWWTGGPLPALRIGTEAELRFDALGGAVDVRALRGVQLAVGYGRDDADILDLGKWRVVHVVE